MYQIRKVGDNYEVYAKVPALVNLDGETTEVLTLINTVSMKWLENKEESLKRELKEVQDWIKEINELG